jgi:hypothetical protein
MFWYTEVKPVDKKIGENRSCTRIDGNQEMAENGTFIRGTGYCGQGTSRLKR